MQQAEIAMKHALGRPITGRELKLLPAGVYTIPGMGMIGGTEQGLKRRGADYVVGCAPYQMTMRGRIIGDTDGFLKLLFSRPDMKLIGAHANRFMNVALAAPVSGLVPPIIIGATVILPTKPVTWTFTVFDPNNQWGQWGQDLFEDGIKHFDDE